MDNIQSARLSLVDGARREGPSEMGQVAVRRGTLYVLVEVSAPTDTWDEASRQIVNKAMNAFATSKLGESNALQAAADAVNAFLLARNKTLPKSDHIWAGFNAAFLRDDDLFLAQAGPALTYIARGGSVTRYPKSFSDLQTTRMDALAPLGERPEAKSRLARFKLQPGDLIALAASHLPTLGSEESITQAVRRETPEAVIAAFQEIARGNDFSALALQWEPPTAPTVSAPVVVSAPKAAPKAEPKGDGWEAAEWDDEAEDGWTDARDKAAEADGWDDKPAPSKPAPKTTPRAAAPRPAEPPTGTARRVEPPPETTRRVVSAPPSPDRETRRLSDPAPRPAEPPRPAPRAAVPARRAEAEPRVTSKVPTPEPERRASRKPPASAPDTPPADSEAPKRATRARQPREPEVIPGKARAVPADSPRESRRQAAPATLRPFAERVRAGDTGTMAAGAASWQNGGRRVAAWLVAAAAALLGAFSRSLAWTRESLGPRLAGAAPALDRVAQGAARALDWLWYQIKVVLWQVLPGERAEPARRAGSPAPGDGSGFMRAAVIVVPLLVVLAVAVVALAGRGNEPGSAPAPAPVASNADYATLVAQARERLAQAGNVDETTAQALVLQADELLRRAEPLEAGTGQEGQVAALRQQAQGLISRASTIVRPPTLTLATLVADSQPAAIVQGGGSLFALERARGAVYRILPGAQGASALDTIAPLLSAQQRLGEGIVVGAPHRIAWVPAGGGRPYNGLLMLTAEGQLFDFDLSSGILKMLAFSTVAGDLRAMEGYGGNVYLLDRANRQVWKYSPDAAGQFGAAPQPWLNQTGQQQFGAPLDMAIDGFIYLLDESGDVGRFQVGERKAGFALDPVTPPLTQPVAMAKVPPEATDLFIADAQRVVRFDANGRFLVEYRAPLGTDWGTIRDITVDERGETLFVLSTNGLYAVDLRNTRREPAQ